MTKQKITDVTGVENCNARVVKYNVRFMHDASQQKRRSLSASAIRNHHVHFPLEKQKHSFPWDICHKQSRINIFSWSV